MKKLIAILCTLLMGQSFAYYISDASKVCGDKAQKEIQDLLEYEKNQQNGSQVNYIVRKDIDVQHNNDPHDLVDVTVKILTYTLDDDQFEINETYTFSAEFDRDTKTCDLGVEPDYSGVYCGFEGEPACFK